MATDQPGSLIAAAVDVANDNALRLALYQQTGDERLARMTVTRSPIRGGASYLESLGDDDVALVKQLATEYLSAEHPPPADDKKPAGDNLRKLLEMFTGGPQTDDEFGIAVEELSFAGRTPVVSWTDGRPALPEDFRVVVIGAGISGIAAGIHLSRLGIPYTIIERQPDLGGTWQLNQYPDARVDTSCFAYQFKFAQDHRWKHLFPPQAEVLEYLSGIAEQHDLRSRIQFDTELRKATWDDSNQVWKLALVARSGERRYMTANVILSCAGLFSTPNIPDIEGLPEFRGRAVHTAGWRDAERDYAGRRVAIIGNGSTGVQLMPRIAEAAQHLLVFQRTPQWIAEVPNYRGEMPAATSYLLDHMPGYWNWLSYAVFLGTIHLQHAQTHDESWQQRGGFVSEVNDKLRSALTGYIRQRLASRPELIPKVLPDYAPLGRRLVIDSGWYDALLRPDVELVTDPITRITEDGIVTADGSFREVDTIVTACGFKTAQYLWPVHYTGRAGLTTEEEWRADGARAYLGMVMPGFPNLFMFYGPNGQPRAGAFHSWAEVWARYSVRMIVALVESGGRSMQCRRDVFTDYNERMDAASQNIIWEREAANSYYVNEFGRSSVNMPWRAEEYHGMVRASDLGDYDVK